MSITIELGDGTQHPMTPPPALGAGFAAVIAEALTWTPEHREEVENKLDAVLDANGTGEAYDQAAERIVDALRLARLDWSCAFGEPDALPEAGPYLDTLNEHHMDAASAVAAAVLARDLRIITEADFNTVAGWWIAAGLPLPRVDSTTIRWATDADQVDQYARELHRDAYRVPGWPLAAAAGLGVSVLDGRYAGMPGLSWYRETREVGPAALAVGDHLDTDDRSGHRAITSIPFGQPATDVRVVTVGAGEPLVLDLSRRYRVVNPHTLVDIDVERPFVFRGGPRDGQVTFQPRAMMPQHCMPTDNDNVHMLTWAHAEAWPADTERYIYSGEEDGEAALMDWRTPTDFEIQFARDQRRNDKENEVLDAELGSRDDEDEVVEAALLSALALHEGVSFMVDRDPEAG